MRLLLVEDDSMLSAATHAGLSQLGWEVDCVGSASSARAALVEHTYAAVLLDLGLPGASGLTVIAFLRERYDDTPVIVLTARGQLSDRIRGLDAGADDYLVKPFQLEELMARVRAIARRSQGRVVPLLQHGDVQLDPAARLVTRAGQVVALSPHEYTLLLALLERRGRAVSRETLESLVYGADGDPSRSAITVFIHQLRRKLGDDLIATVHGHGYTIAGTTP
ncbi:response regulator [Bacillus subtilis subsp. subtilis]|nr:response regulator [Bacillus subtilis subsp. subtilis]